MEFVPYPWHYIGIRPDPVETTLLKVPGLKGWFRWALLRPVAASVGYQESVAAMQACDFDFGPANERWESEIRSWNPASRIARPSFLLYPEVSWARGRRIALDLEAARRVIALKAALAAAGRPPRTDEELQALVAEHGLETGSLCQAGGWVYQTTVGAWVVRFEGPEIPSLPNLEAAPLEQRIPWLPHGRR
jgi:hypothetical protein